MNAQRRNANRETARNLQYSLMAWNSRNRKLVPVLAVKAQPKQQ